MQAFVHSCHHDTGEHAAYLSDGSENSCSFCYLQRFARPGVNCLSFSYLDLDLLPGSEDVHSAAVQARFEESLEESHHT
jgi:hypothetical protein